MSKSKVLTVEGTEIQLLTQKEEDYISITDIIRRFEQRTDLVIQTWMRNMSTIEYLGLWEQLHNPDFNPYGFAGIKEKTGSNSYYISISQWVSETNAKGLVSKPGRYGGTFAHKDIAIQFCYWLNPTFQLYLIKEFQRLKEAESSQLHLQWNLRRELAKANFYIHTDAVRENLVPALDWNTKRESIQQASEADLLNLALFGMTAKEWKLQNPEAKGNMRDQASIEQLLVLANLESLNAEFIRLAYDRDQRVRLLHKAAQTQMEVMAKLPPVENIKKLNP
ncbi:MAG: KilA-N domain-containing protein [Bacteroidetes bacterium]|nr:KilA-N domain-containing protein [Bacteroidota bacterium]